MKVADFDFVLPEDRIALRPVSPRDAARLLVVRPDGLDDRQVRDLPALLRPGDALVVNDTRVIAARLRGARAGREPGSPEVRIECLLHRRLGADRWLAFARPAKRLAAGDRLRFGAPRERACALSGLDAAVTARGPDGQVELAFDLAGPVLDEAVALLGELPLPPYIAGRRAADAADAVDYQTVYAREAGAVAAPTAGLHFTPELMARLGEAGIALHAVTLHVGAGTFLPVKAEDTAEHRMHAETALVGEETAAALTRVRARGGRVVAVGTTVLRTLETAAAQGGRIAPFAGETDIFITPGHRFRAVDGLMTNFHLPRSTLFMLVCALGGLETMRAAYAHAIAAGYRFYSYGDASLIVRDGTA